MFKIILTVCLVSLFAVLGIVVVLVQKEPDVLQEVATGDEYPISPVQREVAVDVSRGSTTTEYVPVSGTINIPPKPLTTEQRKKIVENSTYILDGEYIMLENTDLTVWYSGVDDTFHIIFTSVEPNEQHRTQALSLIADSLGVEYAEVCTYDIEFTFKTTSPFIIDSSLTRPCNE